MRRNFLTPWFWLILVAFMAPVASVKAGSGPGTHKHIEKAAFAEEVTALYEQINLK